MVKLSDIAQETGVSVSTVSRVLNDSPAISEGTKRKVLEAARRMGYRRGLAPLAMARSGDVAGVIVPEMLSEYYARFVHAAIEKFRQKNFSALIATTNFDPEEAVRAVRQMYRCQVKCLLIILDDCEEVSQRLLSVVRQSNLPAMFITATYIPEMDFDCLYVDEARGSVMAVEHLLHRGYSQIAFLGEENTANRRDLFLKTMARFEMPVRPEFVRLGKERAEQGGYARMRELLALKKLPDAVFASYDQMAIGAIHAIDEAGLRIPQDIAVIGANGIPIAGYIHGGLTTVASPFSEMVDIAVRIVLRRMDALYTQPQQIAIKPILLVRATT